MIFINNSDDSEYRNIKSERPSPNPTPLTRKKLQLTDTVQCASSKAFSQHTCAAPNTTKMESEFTITVKSASLFFPYKHSSMLIQ